MAKAESQVQGTIDKVIEAYEKQRQATIDKLKGEKERLNKQRDELTADIDDQIKTVDKALLKMGVGQVAKLGGASVSGRRSGEEMRQDALTIVRFLRSNPGSSGQTVKKETQVDYGLDLKEFLEKHGEVKVETEGERRGKKYSIGE